MKKTLTMLLLVFGISQLSISQYSDANDRIYNAFKSNQFNFPPPPKPLDTVYVGEWDALEYDPELSFKGIKGNIVEPHGSIRTTTHLPGLTHSFSFKYKLKFTVKNLQPGFTFYVKLNGVSYQAGNGKTDIIIGVGDKTKFDWEIGNGISKYKDKLHIQRVPVVVSGVFKVPLMPLLVVYEPAPNNNGTNKAEYIRINTFGSSSTIGISKNQNRTLNTTKLTDIDVFKGILKVESEILGKIPDANAKAAATVLGVLADDGLWGGVTSTTTTGKIEESELTIISEDIQTSGISTDINSGGPGFGDVMVGVKNARFLWIINDGKFYATMLDFQEPFTYDANSIRDSIRSGSNKDIYKAIAQVNPFTANSPRYNLKSDPIRFIYMYDKGGEMSGNSSQTYTLEQSVTQSTRNSITKYTIDIDEYKKGFLSYLNISPFDANETYKLEVSNKVSNQVATGTVFKASLTLQNAPGEHKNYHVFFDKVYGTFVVQDASNVDPVSSSGTKGQKGNHNVKIRYTN